MSWFKTIEKKSMALPFDVPEEVVNRDSGAWLMDQRMNLDTAKKERALGYELEGAGEMGLAGKKDDFIVKYTFEDEEVLFAEKLINADIPCLVKVFKVERNIQTRPHVIHKILMEKLHKLPPHVYSRLPYYGTPPSTFLARSREAARTGGSIEKGIFEFAQCIYKHCKTGDIHRDNVGMRNGQLVLFDLGGGSLNDVV